MYERWSERWSTMVPIYVTEVTNLARTIWLGNNSFDWIY